MIVRLCLVLAGLSAAPLAVAAAQAGPDPKSITPAMVALGDSIYHGRVGGALCQVCHGPAGKGVNPLGPSLVDAEWLHGDGSYAFIVNTVDKGVDKPKKSAAPMPAKGGGQLTPAQVLAVAAYVYSLNQKDAPESRR